MLQAHKLIAPLAVGINCSGSMTTVRSVALYSSAAENVKDRLDAANKKVGKVLADGLGAAGMYSYTTRRFVPSWLIMPAQQTPEIR